MSTATVRPWRLSEVTRPLSEYRPTLALTLVRSRDGAVDVLTGARTHAANATHQGVISVPTLRVPETVAQQWLSAAEPDASREVANLLARKVGVADALELGRVRLRQLDLRAWQGTSVIGEDEHGLLTEDLTMFNACVEVCAGDDEFPRATASYDPLVWARAENFLRMVQTREVAALNADLDALEFCVYGLCLETAARVLLGSALKI